MHNFHDRKRPKGNQPRRIKGGHKQRADDSQVQRNFKSSAPVRFNCGDFLGVTTSIANSP
jgi:hypothetical protein